MHNLNNGVAVAAVMAAAVLGACQQQRPFPMEPLRIPGAQAVPVQKVALQQARQDGTGFATTTTPLPVSDGVQAPQDVVGELQWMATTDLVPTLTLEETPEAYAEAYEPKLGPGELRIVFNTGPVSYKAMEDEIAFERAYAMAHGPANVPAPIIIQQHFYQAPPVVVSPVYGAYGGFATPYFAGFRGGNGPVGGLRGYSRPGGYDYGGNGAYGGRVITPGAGTVYRLQGTRGWGGSAPAPGRAGGWRGPYGAGATPLGGATVVTAEYRQRGGQSMPVPPGTVVPISGGVTPFVPPAVEGAEAAGLPSASPEAARWTSGARSGVVYRSGGAPAGGGGYGGGASLPGARPVPRLVPSGPVGGLSGGPALTPPRFGPTGGGPTGRVMPGVVPMGLPAVPSTPPGTVAVPGQ